MGAIGSAFGKPFSRQPAAAGVGTLLIASRPLRPWTDKYLTRVRRAAFLLLLPCALGACSGFVLHDSNRALPVNFVVAPTSDRDAMSQKCEADQNCPTPGVPLKDIENWRRLVLEKDAAGTDKNPASQVKAATHVRPRHELVNLLDKTSPASSCGWGDANERSQPRQCDFGHELKVLFGNSRSATSPVETRTKGIALSGGGSRAGFFSVGALKALYEAGELHKTHYLSTVSGGGYAAYWYYTQLSNPRTPLGLGSQGNPMTGESGPFKTCRPKKLFGQSSDQRTCGSDAPEGGSALCTICGTDSGSQDTCSLEECPKDESRQRDDLAAQLYLARHTDLLAKEDATFGENLPGFAAELYPGVGATLFPLLPNHPDIWLPAFIFAVPHHIANTLFDWAWNGSPYGAIYRSRIHQVWGADPYRNVVPDCHQSRGKLGKQLAMVKDEKDRHSVVMNNCLYYAADTGSPLLDSSLTARTRDYWIQSDADRGKDQKPYPLWIINTMAIPSNSIWSACSPAKDNVELKLHAYEFTPFGYGSGLFGYYLRNSDIREDQGKLIPLDLILPHELDPLHAVHASGAAFDSAGTDKLWRCGLRLVEQLGNISLGLRVTNVAYAESERNWHQILPWPFYYLHGERGNARNTEIYLTDGGHVDNLGLYALIRRGVGDIIVIDSTADAKGVFDDLRKVAVRLEREGVGIWLKDLCEGGDGRNGTAARSPCAHDELFKFAVNDSMAIDKYRPREASRSHFEGYYYLLSSPEKGEIGKIRYIKASLPADEVGSTTGARKCDWDAKRGMPCTTRMLLATEGKDGDNLFNRFPNRSTLAMVFDSRAEAFWAYRDLGYYLTMKLLTSPKPSP